MKNIKIVIVLLIGIFVFSALSVAASALVQCPRCYGTGKIASQSCITCGGAGVVQPNVTRTGLQAGGSEVQTNVTATFHNNENVEVYGIATATVKKSATEVYEGSSNRTSLPPNGVQVITVSIDDLKYQGYYACILTFTAEPIPCPACSGTGAGSQVNCPDCGGTGYVTESAIEGINFASVGAPIIGVAAVVVGTVVAVVVVKKRKLSEEKIRGLTSFDYQNWVIQRLSGHGGSILDSRKGIDGFTGDGAPIAIKQSDNVGKVQIDNFMNAIMQVKAKRGIIVAFGFDKEAYATASRAKMNYRIEIKLVTVKELIEHKETVLL